MPVCGPFYLAKDTVLRIETLQVRIPSLFSFRVVGWERASLWTILPCQSADRVGGRGGGGGPRGGVGVPNVIPSELFFPFFSSLLSFPLDLPPALLW